LKKRGGDVLKYVTVAKKPRKNISTIVAGKAITKPDVYEKVQAYQKSSEDKKKSKTKGNTITKAKGMKGTKTIVQPSVNPGPSTSKPPNKIQLSSLNLLMTTAPLRTRRNAVFVGNSNPLLLKRSHTLNL
jgi:hypothetical protein